MQQAHRKGQSTKIIAASLQSGQGERLTPLLGTDSFLMHNILKWHASKSQDDRVQTYNHNSNE